MNRRARLFHGARRMPSGRRARILPTSTGILALTARPGLRIERSLWAPAERHARRVEPQVAAEPAAGGERRAPKELVVGTTHRFVARTGLRTVAPAHRAVDGGGDFGDLDRAVSVRIGRRAAERTPAAERRLHGHHDLVDADASVPVAIADASPGWR